MKFCERHQRQARATRNRGLRSQDRTTRWQQGGVGWADRDIATPRVDSAPKQQEQQRPLTAPRTARKYTKDAPLQSYASTPCHDVTNAGPQPGLGSSGGSDTIGVGGENTVENAIAVVTASDGRIACSNCQRWFSSDRVGVHQDICRRVNAAASSPDGDRSKSGTARTATINKQATSASSSIRSSSRRRSRARDARGRSVDREKRSIRDRYDIDDAGDRMVCTHRHEA